MRFYDLCLEVKELDLKDEFENKEEISNFKSTKSQVINNSSSPIGIVNLDIFSVFVSGYNQKFSEEIESLDMIS